jgi:tetratricopeptide (TPR) repeat protein
VMAVLRRTPNWWLSVLSLAVLTVLFTHGMLDVGLHYAADGTLFWLCLGLAAAGGMSSVTGERTLEKRSLSRGIWAVVAVGSALFGLVIFRESGVCPVAAGWNERQARMAEDRGAHSDAAYLAHRAIEWDSTRLHCRYYLAGLLAESGDPDQQRQAILEGLALSNLAPDYADLDYNLGRLLLAAGEVEAAVEFLGRSVRMKPTDHVREKTYREACKMWSARQRQFAK